MQLSHRSRWENPCVYDQPASGELFPGQYFDAETGLHYNYLRYYDPQVGRYIRNDPIGLRGGINLYIYANNNPLRYIDFLGLVASDKIVPNPIDPRDLRWLPDLNKKGVPYPPPPDFFPDDFETCNRICSIMLGGICQAQANFVDKITCIKEWRVWCTECTRKVVKVSMVAKVGLACIKGRPQ